MNLQFWQIAQPLLPDNYQVCPVSCVMLMFSEFQICLCLLEKGGGIEFPQQPAILADCTTIINGDKPPEFESRI